MSDIKLELAYEFCKVVSILDQITIITIVEPDLKVAKEKITIMFKTIDGIFAKCYQMDTTKEYLNFINEYHAKTQLLIKAISNKGIK